MLVSIQLGNAVVINIDDIIKKLEKYRDNIKDGAAIKRNGMFPKTELLLDIFFYSGTGRIGWICSAPGHSVKEFEDDANEAYHAGYLWVDGDGEISFEENMRNMEGQCSKCSDGMLRSEGFQADHEHFKGLYCCECGDEINEMLRSNERKLVYDDSGNDPETPPQAYTFRQFITLTKVPEESCFEEWENLSEVEVTCFRCGVLDEDDVKYLDKLQCGKCGNIELKVEVSSQWRGWENE